MEKDESLLKFPCDFTLKIFGRGTDEFDAAVLMIVHKHAPNLSGVPSSPVRAKMANIAHFLSLFM